MNFRFFPITIDKCNNLCYGENGNMKAALDKHRPKEVNPLHTPMNAA